jgi:hypothetical protein
MSDADTPGAPRVPDFLIMVVVVAAALIIGAVVLVVVPHGDPVAAPTAAPTRPAPSLTPTPSADPTTAGADCFPDADLAARFVPAPPEAVEVGQLRGLSDADKIAMLWAPIPSLPDWRAAMADQLHEHGFQGCIHRYWETGDCACGHTAVLTRFATERDADAIVAIVGAGLTGRYPLATDSFDFAEGSQWFHSDFFGDTSLTGVFARGPYVGFIQLGPAVDGVDQATFFALARQQYERLSPG